MAAAKAIEEGAHSIICASTGNTAASAAAFGARSSIPTGVIIPARGVALGKVAQALIYGACVVPIQGTFDDGLALVRELAARPGVALGQLGQPLPGWRGSRRRPSRSSTPLAIGAGRALRSGRQRRQYHGLLEGVSRVRGRRPVHAGTRHARGFRRRAPRPLWPASLSRTLTRWLPPFASAIRPTGNARSRRATSRTARLRRVSDDGIVEAYRLLAAEEGIFVELASAASVAGLLQRGPWRRGHRRARGVRAYRHGPQGPRRGGALRAGTGRSRSQHRGGCPGSGLEYRLATSPASPIQPREPLPTRGSQAAIHLSPAIAPHNQPQPTDYNLAVLSQGFTRAGRVPCRRK